MPPRGSDAAFVVQWHMIGMFGPSFFTGVLINRLGVLNVILAGIVLLFVCILSALAGTTLFNFWTALFLLGIGWNFMYMGGSALLTECHTPKERAKTQVANDFMVFTTGDLIGYFRSAAEQKRLACDELRVDSVSYPCYFGDTLVNVETTQWDA